jgi:hypothetical protein
MDEPVASTCEEILKAWTCISCAETDEHMPAYVDIDQGKQASSLTSFSVEGPPMFNMTIAVGGLLQSIQSHVTFVILLASYVCESA